MPRKERVLFFDWCEAVFPEHFPQQLFPVRETRALLERMIGGQVSP